MANRKSSDFEFNLAATRGGKRPPEPEATAKKVSKKEHKTRALLGNGLAGRAMDALAARRKRMEKMADQ